MKIAIVIETYDRRIRGGQNYLGATLQNLQRAGVWTSPYLHSVQIVNGGELPDFFDTEVSPFIPATDVSVEYHECPATGCTRQQNGARAIRAGGRTDADWVLKLEDDVDFLDEFLNNVVRWLADYGELDTPMFALGAAFENPHVARYFDEGENILGPGYSFPRVRKAIKQGRSMLPHRIAGFFGGQALLWKREVAKALGDWLGDDPYLPDGKLQHRDRGHDLLMQIWAHQIKGKFFAVPVPAFVQHIGAASSMGNPVLQFPFPGRNWSYARQPKAYEPFEGRRRRLLWVGDAGCDSGFAKATHKTLETLSKTFDVSVLGVNYRGDGDVAQQYPYRMYPAWVVGGQGSLLGDKRLADICQKENPDVIVIQNDPWNIPHYMKVIDQMIPRPKVVGAIAVDGKNCRAKLMKGLDRAIFWTEFAKEEAIAGGLECPAAVVPLGVDLDVFSPGDQLRARQRIGLPQRIWDAFIVGNVNRNQPRKRLDLTIRIFGEFLKRTGAKDAYLYLHVCPTGDVGYNCEQLASYFGFNETPETSRLILAQPDVWNSPPEDFVVQTLRAFSAQMSTTQGEGMGLTTLEGMACGIPQGPLPDWSALGEWAREGALLVPCSGTVVTPVANSIGGIIDVEKAVDALVLLYTSQTSRDEYSRRALALARQPRFRWDLIGQQFTEQVDRCLQGLD